MTNEFSASLRKTSNPAQSAKASQAGKSDQSECFLPKQGEGYSEQSLVAGMPRSRYIAQAGIIAAMYAGLTLVTLLFLGGLAWGPVQFRISEAVCVVAALTPAAIPGLTIGCILANLLNMLIAGTGALGLLDVVFGSMATLVGAIFCWKMRSHPVLAIGGFVVANAIIVPAYLPLLLQGLGFYTIPFTSIALDGAYLPMYLFGLVSTGIGEALVIYILGLPLLHSLKHAGLSQSLTDSSDCVRSA